MRKNFKEQWHAKVESLKHNHLACRIRLLPKDEASKILLELWSGFSKSKEALLITRNFEFIKQILVLQNERKPRWQNGI